MLAFNSFKLFAVKNWTRIDIDFDSRTRRQIEEVFLIENSVSFLLSKFVAETMDYFFRFAYIACFILYLCERLSVLYDLLWLYAVSIAVFLASFLLYTYIVLKLRMYAEDWTFSYTWQHYMKCRCIFPQQKFKIGKRKSEEGEKKSPKPKKQQ